MSLLRQQMSPTRPAPSVQQQHQVTPPVAVSIKVEPDVEDDLPIDDDLLPTDLSMEHPTDLSPSRFTAPDHHRAIQCHQEANISVSRDSNAQYNGVKIKSDSESTDESK